ncbi:MAG: signal peptide peptidase SppA [Tepidisphaeraceae bacterium]
MSQSPGHSFPPPLSSTPLPPPVYFPPMYAPPRGGFARGIFNALAVTILGMSITLNIYLLIANGIFSSDHVRKTTLTEGDASNVIAVIPVEGTITESTAERFDQLAQAIASDASVKGIVVQIDTPGGSVTASDEIYDRILRLKKEKGLPVVASIGALGTSGGYYLSCAADKIVAERTSWTGNIGVLLPRYNIAELAQKYGVKETTLHSTGADFKDAGSMFKDDTPAQTAYWQNLVDQAFGTFKAVIATGRKLDEATVDQIANGKVYTGPEAERLKLVDQIGYLNDAVQLAADQAGIGNVKPNVVKYELNKGLLESFGASGSMHTGGISSQIDGVTVVIDRDLVDSVFSPRLMYLWQGR